MVILYIIKNVRLFATQFSPSPVTASLLGLKGIHRHLILVDCRFKMLLLSTRAINGKMSLAQILPFVQSEV